MPDYLQYFALWTIAVVVLLYMDKKNAARYAALGVFTVLLAAFAEPMGKVAGFWDYDTGPLFFGANVFTILNYFNYNLLVYMISEKVYRRLHGH